MSLPATDLQQKGYGRDEGNWELQGADGLEDKGEQVAITHPDAFHPPKRVQLRIASFQETDGHLRSDS